MYLTYLEVRGHGLGEYEQQLIVESIEAAAARALEAEQDAIDDSDNEPDVFLLSGDPIT